MSIPQPNKGQPIDSSYISKIANAINELSTKVTSKFSVSKVHTPNNGQVSTRTSDIVMVGGYQRINNTSTSTVSEVAIAYGFGLTFKYPPVVTATPIIIDTSLANKNVFVYVKDVTTSSVTIVVRFGTVDTSAVGVNILALGLPTN
jgi:hypothetical protein